MKVEAVTFDFHNTVARCDEWFRLEIRDLAPAFLRWHARQGGVALPEATLHHSVEIYRRLRLDIMQHGVEKDAAACIDIVTRDLGLKFDPETIERGLHDIMHETLADSNPLDGIVPAVRTLRDHGVKLGVVSSAVYDPFIHWSLAKFGIADAFDSVVSSASCGFYKSRIEIYEAALDELGVRPEHAVHVGDSYRFDVETATLLGMRTVWLDADEEATQNHKAGAVVNTLAGVDRIILNGLSERQP